MSNRDHTIAAIGEFELLRKIVIPTVGGNDSVSPLGDDCAFVRLPTGNHDLVVTTDVAPQPLTWHLGQPSYRTWGWYSVAITISDLASAGALPLVITTSVEAPNDMSVQDFTEFFEGMADAAREHNIANAGGNIREAPKFACHATAIGLTPKNRCLRRNGTVPGDYFFSVGECGKFSVAFLKAKKNGYDSLTHREQDVLSRPRARTKEMQFLFENGLINAASDNSDGVLGSLWNIAEASKCSVELEMSNTVLPEHIIKAASEYDYNPWNLMFFWGDWQVIVSVPFSRISDFKDVTNECKIPIQYLGRACKGEPQLIGRSEQRSGKLRLIRNENFVKLSFNQGAIEHVESMLCDSLWL